MWRMIASRPTTPAASCMKTTGRWGRFDPVEAQGQRREPREARRDAAPERRRTDRWLNGAAPWTEAKSSRTTRPTTRRAGLGKGGGMLEEIRMRELILRFLPPPPGVVLDVGGGPGRYSCWLAEMGFEAHLVDPVEKHVRQAREASESQPRHPLASVALGDARSLDHRDGAVDVVLLMGPLYHLTARERRLMALREAHRVLKPGGLLVAKADQQVRFPAGRPHQGLHRRPGLRCHTAPRPRGGTAPGPRGWFQLLHDGVLPPAGRAGGRGTRGGIPSTRPLFGQRAGGSSPRTWKRACRTLRRESCCST